MHRNAYSEAVAMPITHLFQTNPLQEFPLKCFSFPLMGDTLFVITSFVSGISASFLLKHLLMLIVVWCSASITRQSKLRVLSIMTTKRVDSFPTKGKKNSKNVYYHSHIIRTVTNKVNRTENFNESWTLF